MKDGAFFFGGTRRLRQIGYGGGVPKGGKNPAERRGATRWSSVGGAKEVGAEITANEG
jgi:hypothetical protein